METPLLEFERVYRAAWVASLETPAAAEPLFAAARKHASRAIRYGVDHEVLVGAMKASVRDLQEHYDVELRAFG